MCLATPMRIEKVLEGKKRALVSQGKVTVEIDVSLLPDPQPGTYVIVHAGFAIETLSGVEAEERLELFKRLAELSGETGGA
jgi:hydrogenase expression/formation protein HypC